MDHEWAVSGGSGTDFFLWKRILCFGLGVYNFADFEHTPKSSNSQQAHAQIIKHNKTVKHASSFNFGLRWPLNDILLPHLNLRFNFFAKLFEGLVEYSMIKMWPPLVNQNEYLYYVTG